MANEPIGAKEGAETEVEGKANKEGFDSVAAFNTEGFAEFLANYDDAENLDPASEEGLLETRFNAFKNTKEAAKGLSDVFAREIDGQGLGIRFEDELLATHIGERVEGLAHENPAKVNEIFEQVSEFNRLLGEIEDAEEEIAKFESKGDLESALEKLKEKKDILEKASDTTGALGGFVSKLAAAYEGFAFKNSVEFAENWLANNEGDSPVETRKEMEDFIAERTSARGKYSARLALEGYSIKPKSEDVDAALEQTEKEILIITQKIEALDTLVEKNKVATKRFAEIREALLMGVGTNKALREAAMEKAIDRLDDLLNSNPDEAQLYFEKMKQVSESNGLGIDYFNGKADEAQKEVEKRIDVRLAEDMKKAIEKSSFGSKAYDNMAKSLEAFVKKNKIGTKEGDTARTFVFDTLKSIAKEISPNDKARGLLLRFMIVKLQGAAA